MSEAMSSTHAPRALIVDSNPEDGALIARILDELGYQCTVTENFAGFRTLFDPSVPVVFIDLKTPDVDGVEILRILGARECRAGVVVTGESDQRVIDAAVRLGKAKKLWVIGGVTKPIQSDQLRSLLKDAGPKVKERTRRMEALLDPDDLKRGIEASELVVYYQPKINLSTLEFLAAEALVRWQHPKHGLVGPDRFIKLAEISNLIDPLTECVMRQAFAACASWKKSGLEVKVSINVSSLSLSDLHLPDKFEAIAEEFGLDREQIIFEITESTLSEDKVTALDVLTRLRVKGFDLSIDDFGTGYANMKQLSDLPFSELKLDRHFVSGATGNYDARAIVQSSIELGRELNLKVVAEGIETQEDWELISNMGCDEGQGFFIASPMPAEDLLPWLERWNTQLGEKKTDGEQG